MENKAIQIEPKAATEMQSWTNIYDRVPSQYRQYVSYPTTTMKECPSKAEINSKITHACTTDSNELADYSYEDNQWIQTPYTLAAIATKCNSIVKDDDVICVNGIDVYMVG